jgi:hypothetical protein
VSNDVYTPRVIELLTQLHDLTTKDGVGYTTVFEESAGTWYVTIESAAPSECFVGKSRGFFEFALEDAIQFLQGT